MLFIFLVLVRLAAHTDANWLQVFRLEIYFQYYA